MIEAASATQTIYLPSLPPTWQVLSYSILSDGNLAVAATDVDLAGEHQRIADAWQTSKEPDPPSRINKLIDVGHLRIMSFGLDGWIDAIACPLETPFPLFDRFEDGRWLVVAARTNQRNDARLLATSGVVLDRFHLGDGIEHVAIDATNRIWVGWFDEGVFGNDDWKVDNKEWPPSSNGIGCFDATGAILALPEWPESAGHIADCYALNIFGQSAWLCTYTDFPVVHFSPDGAIRWWRNDHSVPTAIAIADDHALLAGGYGAKANEIVLLALRGAGDGNEADKIGSWSMPLRRMASTPNEWSPVWEPPSLIAGRGDTLHLVDDGVWHQFRVADLVAGDTSTLGR